MLTRPFARCRLLSFGLIAMVVATWNVSASANGRFPRAMRLVESPTDPDLLAVYGTYGLLVSRDSGEHWYHVCEAATGPFNGEAAMLEALSAGRWLLGTDEDLKRSEDQSCSWIPALTPGGTRLLDDVTRSAAGGELYALLNNLDSDAGLYVTVLRSDDEAASFLPFAELSQTAIERAFTIDVAPSDPDRLYVSGVNTEGVGVIVRLTDQGQTSQAFELPLGSAAAAPYIAAVHPSDPDTLFVRTDELTLLDNSTTANDRLLVSRDGGETWVPIIQRHAKLLGFALSPDGSTVLAGYGDPVLFSFYVDPNDVGVYRFELNALQEAGDAGASFEKLLDRSTTCLRWTPNRLYACLTQQQAGFEIGTAPSEAGSRATTLELTPLLDLSTVRPLQCEEDSAVALCLDDIIYGWPVACAKLGAPCDDYGADADANVAPPPPPSNDKDSGCNCRLASHGKGPAASFALLGLALALVAFVRRWRSGSPISN